MARIADRRKAIALRLQGKTYAEIRKELSLAKSTLSNWLSKYPLPQEQLDLLEQKRENSRLLAIEKTRLIKRRKKEARLKTLYTEEKQRWELFTQRDLELAGLFLYWGEGSKRLDTPLSLNNTDPKVLQFTLYWLTNGLHVPKGNIRVFLHLYSDMDIETEKEFWSKQLQLPLSQFCKPYIKKTKRIAIDQKGYGHGTCGLLVNNTRLKERIIMAINAIADSSSRAIE